MEHNDTLPQKRNINPGGKEESERTTDKKRFTIDDAIKAANLGNNRQIYSSRS